MIFHNKLRAFSLLTIILFISSCSDDPSARKKRSAPAHLVETATASYKQVSIEKTLPGTLEAVHEVQIYSQHQGLLTSLNFYEGDRVKQGDIIATLDDALIQAELNKALAVFKQSKLNVKRLEKLARRKLASDDEIAKSQTALDIAQADLKLNKIKLSHTKITAPFNGVISQRLTEPGNVIPLHTHILSLIDSKHLKARLYVSELLLPLIQQHDQVTIKIDALGDQFFKGQVIRHHPTIDADTRRGIIEVSLNPVPSGAVPGQLIRVTLKTSSKTRLMIPFDAVRHDNTGAYVYLIENNKAKRVYIRTGVQNQREIEILEGIEENSAVIINGFLGLKNNKPVTVKVKP